MKKPRSLIFYFFIWNFFWKGIAVLFFYFKKAFLFFNFLKACSLIIRFFLFWKGLAIWLDPFCLFHLPIMQWPFFNQPSRENLYWEKLSWKFHPPTSIVPCSMFIYLLSYHLHQCDSMVFNQSLRENLYWERAFNHFLQCTQGRSQNKFSVKVGNLAQLAWPPPSPYVGIPKKGKKWCLFCILGYFKHINLFMKKSHF